MKTIVLMRAGESKFDSKTREGNRRVVGWTDVDLSAAGRRQAKVAARMLRDEGVVIEAAVTSALRRAVATAWTVLDETDCMWAPVQPDWCLNARHWGTRQGKKHKRIQQDHGPDALAPYRDDPDRKPEPVDNTDRRFPNGPAYRNAGAGRLPGAESLREVAERVARAWQAQVAPRLERTSCVLVVAHHDSLQALAGILGGPVAGHSFRFATPLLCELGDDLPAAACRALPLPEQLYSS